jgi:hypothetical protein
MVPLGTGLGTPKQLVSCYMDDATVVTNLSHLDEHQVTSFQAAMADPSLVESPSIQSARQLSRHWPHAYDVSQHPSDHEDGDSPYVDLLPTVGLAPNAEITDPRSAGFHVSTLADGNASHWLRASHNSSTSHISDTHWNLRYLSSTRRQRPSPLRHLL